MNVVFILGVVALFEVAQADPKCPDGAKIYALDMSDDDQAVALAEHNHYRQMILDGEVDGQPQAQEMPMLDYDNDLEYGAYEVVITCKMEHMISPDQRFSVGQNLFISWSSNLNTTADWPAAVKDWFDENEGYNYPEISNNALHYTQVVWAKTTLVGCYFITYYDNDPQMAQYPYARLYGCNYGPAGNMQGEAPYEEV